jgi:hypothetical protein
MAAGSAGSSAPAPPLQSRFLSKEKIHMATNLYFNLERNHAHLGRITANYMQIMR